MWPRTIWRGNIPSWPRCEQLAAREGAQVVVICGRIEAEISELDGDEKQAFLTGMGLSESGLDRLIRSGYELLGLITYFTAGKKEVRAWTITRGTKAPQAAGVIHSDFEKGFIRAEVIAYHGFCHGRGRGVGKGKGADAAGGERVRGPRRRHQALPLQRLGKRGFSAISALSLRDSLCGVARGTPPRHPSIALTLRKIHVFWEMSQQKLCASGKQTKSLIIR